MTHALPLLLLSAAIALAAPPARASSIDLQPIELRGILDEAAARRLAAATADAQRHDRGILMAVDSPGGVIEAAEKAMISILFAGVPVVAWVPPDGQASGAALFPLMGSDLIAMAPTAHLGSRRGLGRFADLALGPFGERLFAAARESRSGSVDWMVVSVSDGGRIDARGAKRRGVAAVVAPDRAALLRQLRGREVTIPLTGEPATLSGRLVETSRSPSVLANLWRRPMVLACLCAFALCLLALGTTRVAIATLFPVGVVALGVVLRASDTVPLSPSAVLLMGLGASLLALVPVRRWGAWVAIAAGPLLALGALIFIDVEATGYFLDESARMPATAASLVAAVLVIGALALGRLGPGAERWKAAADPVELPRTT